MKPYYEHAGITIYHGDCRDVLPTVAGFDLLLTDPPYGIDYQHGGRADGLLLGFDGHAVAGDSERFDPVHLLGLRCPSIIWGANHFADRLPASGGWLVWDKRDGIPPNDQSDCELAWTNIRTTARLCSRYWNGGRIDEVRFHVSQKPQKVLRWAMGLAPATSCVLDPYMGSGSTLRAAKDAGLSAIGIEIEERYCEIAANRLSQEVFNFAEPLPADARTDRSGLLIEE